MPSPEPAADLGSDQERLGFGPDIIRSVRSATKLPFEAHFMVEEPETLIDPFVKAGVNRLIVHAEACRFPIRLASKVRGSSGQSTYCVHTSSQPQERREGNGDN
ncbi:MAG: hypothetical protein HY335_00340, partial [Deinococcus sp.]|nr:hypothetical protein [Deinococcus sp.]